MPLSAINKEKNQPRGLQAYHSLREAIQTGKLLPGTRLREQELAEQLGLSRTPIREALTRLENEGLVCYDSNGLTVTKLDYTMMSELYVMREVLESTAARLAARHATEVEVSVLKDIAANDKKLLAHPEKLAANNKFFHEMLYQCSHNRYLLKAVNTLQDSMCLLGPTTLSVPERGLESAEEHQQLINALENHDEQAAEQLTRKHIQAAYKTRLAMQLLNKQCLISKSIK